MEAVDAAGELLGVTYFKVRDGKRVERGMPVRITPDTVERERHGGILARVTEVSPFPVTAQDVENVVGHGPLAQDLIHGGYLIQVTAELQRESGPAGAFVWSSRPPEQPVTEGTTTSARVAVEQRRPITLLFPALKTAIGVD
jgi:HlyD family secretion protein